MIDWCSMAYHWTPTRKITHVIENITASAACNMLYWYHVWPSLLHGLRTQNSYSDMKLYWYYVWHCSSLLHGLRTRTHTYYLKTPPTRPRVTVTHNVLRNTQSVKTGLSLYDIFILNDSKIQGKVDVFFIKAYHCISATPWFYILKIVCNHSNMIFNINMFVLPQYLLQHDSDR